MTLKIGSLQASKGQKKTGYLPVGESTLREVSLPLTLINGVENGPKVAMTAGFHPREYASIESLVRLSNVVNPSDIKGSMIIVHIVNTPGYEIRGRNCPIDDAHPINSFPGKQDGAMSQKIAYTISNEILSKSDYYIDNHCNDVQWVGPSNIIYPSIGEDKVDSVSESMARCFKTKYLRKSQARDSRSALGYAAHQGIPSILTEVGSMMGISSTTGTLDEKAIQWNIDGITNVMKLLGMIEGSPYQSTEKPITNVVYYSAKQSGILHSLAEADEKVSKGQTIAEIRDPFGNVKDTIESTVNGVLSLMTSYRAINQGMPIIQVYEMP
jgi:predicted deacylase